MNWVFLDVAAIKLVQANLIDIYGGSHGVRDENLLASAVARAEMKVNYDPMATVASVAASLSYGLIKNHAFIDGNKRIGLAALINFLALNGHALKIDQEEETAMVLRAAPSEITEDQWTAWVERSVTQSEPVT